MKSIYSAIYISIAIGFLRSTARKLNPAARLPGKRYRVDEQTAGVTIIVPPIITQSGNRVLGPAEYLLAECANIDLARAFRDALANSLERGQKYYFSTFVRQVYAVSPEFREKLAKSGILVEHQKLNDIRDMALTIKTGGALARALATQ